jgi:hypothetical protein
LKYSFNTLKLYVFADQEKYSFEGAPVTTFKRCSPDCNVSILPPAWDKVKVTQKKKKTFGA